MKTAAALLKAIKDDPAISQASFSSALDSSRDAIEDVLLRVVKLHMACDRLPNDQRALAEEMRQKLGALKRELPRAADQLAKCDRILEEIEREWPRIEKRVREEG